MAAPKFFSLEQIILMLKSRQGGRNSSQYAKDLGVSRQFMSDVMSGTRGPSKEMLDSIGMERILLYRVKRS
jgi:hypothetical protein